MPPRRGTWSSSSCRKPPASPVPAQRRASPCRAGLYCRRETPRLSRWRYNLPLPFKAQDVRLTPDEQAAVSALVLDVEARTGVPLVVAVVGKSDSYAELPWKAFAFGASG